MLHAVPDVVEERRLFYFLSASTRDAENVPEQRRGGGGGKAAAADNATRLAALPWRPWWFFSSRGPCSLCTMDTATVRSNRGEAFGGPRKKKPFQDDRAAAVAHRSIAAGV